MAITEAAGLEAATFAQRPDLLSKVFGPEVQSAVPEFMRHDPVGALYYGDGQLDWLISITAMIVLFWSRATRDLLKSFGWGIAGTPSIRCSDEVAISSSPAP